MDFAGFFGFDDIAGFEKIVILRFLIFGFVFLDLSLGNFVEKLKFGFKNFCFDL